MTDFRALCFELAKQLHQYAEVFPEHNMDALVERAQAALAEPEPDPDQLKILARVAFKDQQFNFPSDVALRQYCDDWFYGNPERKEVDPVDLCRGAIQLFAQPRQLIPVSERMPGPEDCLDEGWAWFFNPRTGWRQATQPVHSTYTHWLPAHALPLPTTEA